MTYRMHLLKEHGWEVVKSSPNLDDFNENDKWCFNHILKNTSGWLRMGDTMWDIEW